MALSIGAEERLVQIVGPEHVRPARPQDGVQGVTPRLVVEPGSEQEVAAVLSCADEAGLAVIPRGGGTKLSWGNPPARADLMLSLARLDRVVEHAWADLTVTVEAGCTLAKLQEALAEHEQRLAIDVWWPERATVGGILSTNDSGVLRLRYGGLRDLVIGASLALADGTLAASGGKVVKNVAGYDLPKLATGALGTLGVITRATFRLHPLPPYTKSLTLPVATPEAMQALVLGILDSQLVPSAVQVRASSDAGPEIDVLFEGTEVGVAAQEAALRNLAGTISLDEAPPGVWLARQELWTNPEDPAVVTKLTMLPAHLVHLFSTVTQLASASAVSWRLVLQATGIGWLRLDGPTAALPSVLSPLRIDQEANDGSLVLLHRPPDLPRFDAWGGPGDALLVMRALKHQLDPNGTLNPGRFVGEI